jgi:hypothetical protein
MATEEVEEERWQEALLAIEIAVDALHEADTETSRDALEQIKHLGFDTRRSGERKAAKPRKEWTRKKSIQPTLF